MVHKQFQLEHRAVAPKMARRWIMVELGERGHTIPRLKAVIDSKDKGGITEAVNWNGNGGLRYDKRALVLARCEWGHDNHNLNVADLPIAAPENAPENAVEKQVAQPAQRTAGSFGDSTRDSER